jgi:hypothetical protein
LEELVCDQPVDDRPRHLNFHQEQGFPLAAAISPLAGAGELSFAVGSHGAAIGGQGASWRHAGTMLERCWKAISAATAARLRRPAIGEIDEIDEVDDPLLLSLRARLFLSTSRCRRRVMV